MIRIYTLHICFVYIDSGYISIRSRYGESFDYQSGMSVHGGPNSTDQSYWFEEISGLPFGLGNDMLGEGLQWEPCFQSCLLFPHCVPLSCTQLLQSFQTDSSGQVQVH